MSHESDERAEIVDRLIDDFITEYRRNPGIQIETFLMAYPEISNELRQLLNAALALESARSAPDPIPKPTSFPLISEYRFTQQLGRGGMGIVYKAEHAALSRMVAVKVLSPHLLPDKKARERFKREAKATARLHHTNIVPVFEVGENEELAFYSMQLIDGENLEQRLMRQKETLKSGLASVPSRERAIQAANIGVKIARALQHAHDHQILHRDVKPSNVLIDREDGIWLSDFGLASLSDSQVSQSHELVGTLRYLAPERLTGLCDERSDIYSLGLTLFEYVTLKSPSEEMSREQLLCPERKVPSLRSILPDVPLDFATILDKALHTQPRVRYSNAAEFADDLQRFVDYKPIAARPVSAVEKLILWCGRNPAIAALISSFNCLLIVVAVVASIAANRFRSLSLKANVARIAAERAKADAIRKEREAEQMSIVALRNEELATQVANFFAKMIQGADPSGFFTGHASPGMKLDQSTTVFDWIRQSYEAVNQEDYKEFPLVEARLKDTLGVALTGQMQLPEAKQLLEHALALRKASLPPGDLGIAESLDHLGAFYFFSGDAPSAVEYYQQAFTIRDTFWKQNQQSEVLSSQRLLSEQLARTRSKSAWALAIAFSSQDRSEQSIELLREAIEERETMLGGNHQEVAFTRIALAAILARHLDTTAALEQIQKAETALIQTDGDKRLLHVFSLYAQGTAFQGLQMTDLAIDRFQEAGRIVSDVFGSHHPLTSYARGEIAGALERAGRVDEAVKLYRQVITENERKLANQPYLGQSWETLGICFRGQNKFPEAIEAFEKALVVFQESGVKEPHIHLASLKARLGDCLTNCGRIAEAFQLQQEAADQYHQLPKTLVGFRQFEALHFMSYLALWHQSDRFQDVISRVVAVGPQAEKFEEFEMLLLAGTSGECTSEQATALLEMSNRMMESTTDEHRKPFAVHLRGRIYWQLGRFDEALALLEEPQPNEVRELQSKLYQSLCWNGKGDRERSLTLFYEAVNSIIHRIPKSGAQYLKNVMGHRVEFEMNDPEPTSLIQYHWEQSAYCEFAWRVLNRHPPAKASLDSPGGGE